MNLLDFYQELTESGRQGVLLLNTELCDGSFRRLAASVGIICVEGYALRLLSDQVEIIGTCTLNSWNRGRPFSVKVICREQGEDIVCDAAFWCSMEGTLGELFGDIWPTLIWNQEGNRVETQMIADFPIIGPMITVQNEDALRYFPLRFSAGTRVPGDKRWGAYPFLFQGGIRTIQGCMNRKTEFELEVPLVQAVSGIFSCSSMALFLSNGADSRDGFQYTKISQAGLKIILAAPQMPQSDFFLPLFLPSDHWTLHTEFPQGLGVADIVNFLLELFGLGGSLTELYLPENTLLNQFRLYQMDLLAGREGTSLSLQHLMMEFALASPWALPIPYVTLERLQVGFQASFGRMESLLTASAGGRLSVELGRYQLAMEFQMALPELDFIAGITFSKKSEKPAPSLGDLAQAFQVQLPAQGEMGNSVSGHLLGRIEISGSGKSRSFSIEAGVYDLLDFSLGGLPVQLSSVEAGAQVSTSSFTFYIQGLLAFGEGDDAFSLYLRAAYENPGWVFSGGIYQGEIRIGRLLEQMFGLPGIASDIADLSLKQLDVLYATKTGTLMLTAAFEANWDIRILGREFRLGGRVQIYKEDQKETDVSALAYISLGDFKILAQVDHIQETDGRSFLFRLEYEQAYLQVAWFRRQKDEILSVSLGGMTLGGLLESLIRMINPNKRYSLSAPWNLLNRIELSRFLLEFNVTRNEAAFIYQADLNIAGLMYLEKVGVRYNMNERKVFFILTGKLLGVTHGDENPITWDAVDGQPPVDSAENEKRFQLAYLGLGQHLKNDGIIKADGIAEAMQALKEQINPSSLSEGVSYDAGTNWLFGADFTVNGMLNVKLVLNDPVLYGLLVTVSAKEGSAMHFFDGLGLELLCRRVSSGVYMFRGEMILPERFRNFQLGVVSLTLGTIRVEVYTNGGFYVDLGFPHQMDFSRSFVIQWGVFTGRGGIYFGITKDVARKHVPAVTNGNFSPIVELGIGLSVGLGRSFDLGIVKGGVSLELFGIFEGALAIFHDKDTGKESTYYYVKAVAGIAGRLYLSVDFKIITIQASAEITASASLEIQAYKAAEVEVDLALRLQASIKILFIKIQFSFSFQQKVVFTMGKDEDTPWKLQQEDGVRRIASESRLFCVPEPHAVRAGNEQISLALFPLFYLYEREEEKNGSYGYGAAFLMMMDARALEQWAGLLCAWVLSGFPDETVTAGQAEALVPEQASALTYDTLVEFISQNVLLSYHIHWEAQEEALRMESEEEPERFVFPMLPPLALSFGTDSEEEKTTEYWKDHPVGEDYFDGLSAYFARMNPDPEHSSKTGMTDRKADGGKMAAAKVFFLDYFQMFLREVVGRIHSFYQSLDTDRDLWKASQAYGLSVEELLGQNQDLLLASESGGILYFGQLRYLAAQNDSIEGIRERFSADPAQFWTAICREKFLLRQGSTMIFGEGSFDNTAAHFTLKQAAAVLFVRFYEEIVPEDMFYAGDLVRLNEGLDIDWEETVPGGHVLLLPEDQGTYSAMRGDTPGRISRYLRLLSMDSGSLPQWDTFYRDICERNHASGEVILNTVEFFVPQVQISGDVDLEHLAARISPDRDETYVPEKIVYAVGILRAGAAVYVPGASYTVGQDSSVSQVLLAVPCTLTELAQALGSEKSGVRPAGQMLRVAGAQMISKEELKKRTVLEAKDVGAMLSRFLLQGMRLPRPEPGFSSVVSNGRMVPLFDVLGQMFVLEETAGKDYILAVSAKEEGVLWVEQGEKQMKMSWKQIEKRLPNGDFSGLPERFEQMEDFTVSPRYFSISQKVPCYQEQGCMTIFRFSEGISQILQESSTAPELSDGNRPISKASWGCLLPIEIERCEEDGIFYLYGADAKNRLVLHDLLKIRNPDVHILYQESALNTGGENFREYIWSAEESFLAKTNLSVETHMGFVQVMQDSPIAYVADLTQPQALLRLLWECSTVGGGGYYLQLLTSDGRTLPGDIFDDNGSGTIWLMVQEEDYELLSTCVNCCIVPDAMAGGRILVLKSADPLQQAVQPGFPAGCIGLCAEADSPQKVNGLTEDGEYMRNLFQIVGYQVRAGGQEYISAPLLPQHGDGQWNYHAVVPVYRYAVADGENPEENPYRAIGTPFTFVLELRDVLGNAIQAGKTEVMPYYNDMLIGLGQWPGARISYVLTGHPQQPIFRISIFTALPENLGKGAGHPQEADHNAELADEADNNAARYQRRATMQLACADVEVTAASPVNDETYEFSKILQNGRSFLDLLRDYAAGLADAMEGKTGSVLPSQLDFDFPLDIAGHPMPRDIFELSAKITISRSNQYVKEPAAGNVVTVIWPRSVSGQGKDPAAAFCREAQRVLPGLLPARKAEGEEVLYGVTRGTDGLIRELDVQLYELSDRNLENSAAAPEFYALRPLYHGFLSRQALVRTLFIDYTFSEEWQSVSVPDTDMEIWVKHFLEDIEALLLPGQVQKAGKNCREQLDMLAAAKGRLSDAIALQMTPLRQGAPEAPEDLKKYMADRLKRSLTNGYGTDIAARCRLVFSAGRDCRLSALADNHMEGTQTTVGKAVSRKEDLYLFFTNRFSGKSIPLETDLIFPELEYDILEDEGYESSHWLKFIEPITPDSKETEHSCLTSQLPLPNPLKECPQAPVLNAHSFEIGLFEDDAFGNRLFVKKISEIGQPVNEVSQPGLLGEMGSSTAIIGWNYSLSLRCCYREQDVFSIRIVFEEANSPRDRADKQDLFDVLAEYSIARDSLWEALWEEDGKEPEYGNAYASFTSLTEHAADVWEDWVETTRQPEKNIKAGQYMAYSCTAEGRHTADGIQFTIVSTKEGEAFLRALNLPDPAFELAEKGKEGEILTLRFKMTGLPLFQCAQAVPSVKIIRNQNLLSTGSITFPTREEFIYRTQEVSLPCLSVSGEYTQEMTVASISAAHISEVEMAQAVSDVFTALHLQNTNLMAEFGISYFYGLNAGKTQPRVVLPVTLIPCGDTTDQSGNSEAFIQEIAGNVYGWYQEVKPDGNACGIMFDVSVYLKRNRRKLLHFTRVCVEFAFL